MVKNKQCLACKEKFSYCPDCSRADRLKPTWASQFCSEPCSILWTTLTKFGMSMITKSEAKAIISSLNLRPIDAYVECVKRDYNKVFESDRKTRKIKKLEPVVEIEPMVELEQPIEVAESVAIEPIHEVVLIEKE